MVIARLSSGSIKLIMIRHMYDQAQVVVGACNELEPLGFPAPAAGTSPPTGNDRGGSCGAAAGRGQAPQKPPTPALPSEAGHGDSLVGGGTQGLDIRAIKTHLGLLSTATEGQVRAVGQTVFTSLHLI